MSAGLGEMESPPVALPGSEPPSGIWTVKRGPRGLAPLAVAVTVLKLSDREGGVKIRSTDETETVRDFPLSPDRGGEEVWAEDVMSTE